MNKNQEIYKPNKRENAKITRLCIAAHQDDVELLAYSPILDCYNNPDQAFVAVVTADGAGSARTGIYKDYTDEQMAQVRIKEQKQAADVGQYLELHLLKYPSSKIKDPKDTDIVNDYIKILKDTQPEIVYTHNLADKHPTHLGVVTKVIKAIRSLDKNIRPKTLYGVEVWRDLDWLDDKTKVLLALLGVFDSQIAGGKRYDLAAEGRRLANATFFESHSVDQYTKLNYAVDLTPLIKDDNLDITDYILSFIDQFKNNVKSALKNVL
jgi:LmbE family N-acetylglucosaminyl deacetylase